MTNEEIIKEFAALPAEAKREVENFVKYLRKRYRSKTRAASAKSIQSENFIGMWSDREEMVDSTVWVRGVRDEHWAN